MTKRRVQRSTETCAADWETKAVLDLGLEAVDLIQKEQTRRTSTKKGNERFFSRTCLVFETSSGVASHSADSLVERNIAQRFMLEYCLLDCIANISGLPRNPCHEKAVGNTSCCPMEQGNFRRRPHDKKKVPQLSTLTEILQVQSLGGPVCSRAASALALEKLNANAERLNSMLDPRRQDFRANSSMEWKTGVQTL